MFEEMIARLTPYEQAEVRRFPGLVYQPRDDVRENRQGEVFCAGTFLKEIAFGKGQQLKADGYAVRYYGRGRRSGKKANHHNEIKLDDSVFLAVYGYKRVKKDEKTKEESD